MANLASESPEMLGLTVICRVLLKQRAGLLLGKRALWMVKHIVKTL